MVDTVDKVIIEYASVNFDKTSNDAKTLQGNLEGITEVSLATEKSTASLENRFASLERRFGTTQGQADQFAKIQKDVNLAVAQNPALQDRANEVLDKAGAKFDGAKGAAGALNQVLDAGRGAMLGYAAGAGPVGAVLGSFGPWGIAAAAGIGLVSAALDHMKKVSEEIGTESSALKQFADTTGLTISQVRGLSDAGTSLGVSGDQMASAIQKFTLNLGDARKGGGELYDQLRVIDRQLANDVANTRDGAAALDLLTRAYNSTTDATTKAAIAKAAFGKGGAAVGPVLSVVGDAGGVNEYSAAVSKALGVTDQWTAKVAALRNENKSLEGDLKTIEGSFYTQEMLERQNHALKTQVEIAKAVRDSLSSGSPGDVLAGQMQVADAFGQSYKGASVAIDASKVATESLTQATNGLTQANAASTAATTTETNATIGNTAAKTDNLNAAIRAATQSASDVAALGSVATTAEKIKARIDALTVSYDKGAISEDTYARAKTGVYKDFSSTIDNEATAVGSADKAQQQAADSALAWQQNMLGVGDAAQQAQAAIDAAAEAAHNAGLVVGGDSGSYKSNSGTFKPDINTQSGGFTSDASGGGAHYRQGGTGKILSLGSGSIFSGSAQQTLDSSGVTKLVDAAYAQGGADSAIQALTTSIASNRGIDTGSVISSLSALYDLKNGATGDANQKRANLIDEWNLIATLPATQERDQALLNLTQAINANTSATNNAADKIVELPGVLSSLYSAGQVKGFGFADGGIMTAGGPLHLQHYDVGGVVNSPQVFMAGENYQPEAIIPLQGGAVPVRFTAPPGNNDNGGGQQKALTIIVQAPITLQVMDSGRGETNIAAAQAAQNLRSTIQGYAQR